MTIEELRNCFNGTVIVVLDAATGDWVCSLKCRMVNHTQLTVDKRYPTNNHTIHDAFCEFLKEEVRIKL